MASTIIIKNGAGTDVPSSLKQGELAINVDNGKLFYGTSGSSNAVSSSFAFQHITSSGDISGSGTVSAKELKLTTNGVHKASIDASGNVAVEGYVSASAALLGNSAQFANNGVDTLNISSGGAISASSAIQGTEFAAQTNGVTKASIDPEGNVAAEGNISSSGVVSGTALTLATNGATKATIDASGNIAAEGTISSSGRLFGNLLELRTAGVLKAAIASDGTGSFNGGIDCIGDGINATGSFGYISCSEDVSASGKLFGEGLIIGSDAVNMELGAGTDNSVVVLNSANRLVTDEIDVGVWGAQGSIVTTEGENIAPIANVSANVNAVATTDNTEFFIGVLDGASGTQAVETSTKLKQNPSTGKLTVLGALSSSGVISGTALTLATNGVNAFDISAAGALSASSTIAGTALTLASNGVNVFTATAAGAISASRGYNGTNIVIETDGATLASIDTSGNIAAEGYISSSALLSGTSLDIKVNGADRASIDTSGDLACRGMSGSGIFSANTGQFAHNGINTLNISNAGAISASSTIQGTAFTAQTNGATKATIDASGNVAAEGYVSSSGQLSGTNLDIRSAGVAKASITADGSGSFAGPIRGKQLQVYHANWKDSAGTTEHFIPLAGVPDEGASGFKEACALIMPFSGTIKEIILRMHWASITTSDDITWKIYKRLAAKRMNGMDEASSFTMTNPTQESNDTNNTRRSAVLEETFAAGDAISISMQWASTGPTNAGDRMYVTVVIENDFDDINY